MSVRRCLSDAAPPGKSEGRRARLLRLAMGLAAVAATAGAPLLAHVTTVELTTFLKVQGSTLTVLLRLPASILADAGLSSVAPEDLGQRTNEGPLRAVALEAAKNLDVMSGQRRLPTPSTTWVVSAAGDPSFNSYDQALARLAGPLLPDARELYWNDAFIDLRLDYPIASAPGELSVRFNGYRTPTGLLQTHVRYLPAGEAARQFTISGPPRRVNLDPPRSETLAMFARLGLIQLVDDRELLLFLLCLAIPRRGFRAALDAFAAFLAAHVTAAAAMAVLPNPPDVFFQLLFALVATSALVVVALQQILSARAKWVNAVCLCFGLTKGIAAGLALREVLPLAGSHPAIGLAAVATIGAIAALWLLFVVQPGAQWLYRLGLPNSIATIAVCLLPIHAGLHGIVDIGQQLEATRLAMSSRTVSLALGHWPAFVLALACVILLGVSTLSRSGRHERLTEAP